MCVLGECEVVTRASVLQLLIRDEHRPLLPSTCQSVRMDFLALAPGVHSIDALTALTEIQSGLYMHLRSVVYPKTAAVLTNGVGTGTSSTS